MLLLPLSSCCTSHLITCTPVYRPQNSPFWCSIKCVQNRFVKMWNGQGEYLSNSNIPYAAFSSSTFRKNASFLSLQLSNLDSYFPILIHEGIEDDNYQEGVGWAGWPFLCYLKPEIGSDKTVERFISWKLSTAYCWRYMCSFHNVKTTLMSASCVRDLSNNSRDEFSPYSYLLFKTLLRSTETKMFENCNISFPPVWNWVI